MEADDVGMAAVPALAKENVAKLKLLLSEWKLDYLLPQFVDEKIDLDILKIIDVAHINLLTQKYPIGVQIRFVHNLMKWRKRIGVPLKEDTPNDNQNVRNNKATTYDSCRYSDVSTTPCANSTPSAKSSLPEANNANTKKTQMQETTKSHVVDTMTRPRHLRPVKSQHPLSIDLSHILRNSPTTGPDIIDLYKKQGHLTQHDRQRLMATIVNYFLESKIVMNLQISYELENAIVKMFPTESFRKYRNSRYGKIYLLYLKEKTDQLESERYSDLEESRSNVDDNDDSDTNDNDALMNDLFNKENMDEDNCESVGKAAMDVDHDIFLQTMCDGHKKFVRITPPYDYSEFLTSACSVFNITNIDDYCLHVKDVEIDEVHFKSIILQNYKSITFTMQLQKKSPAKNGGRSDELPDATYMRNLSNLLPFVCLSDQGKPLQNNQRTTIAKTVIDECLKDYPERILKRQDFLTLADNICKAFHTEVPSTYFIPCRDAQPARGKLMNAYNNKRYILNALGRLQRRPRAIPAKRKRYTYAKDEYDKEYEKEPQIIESIEFSADTDVDMQQLTRRWKETHKERRKELADGLKADDYVEKYSLLKSIRGIDLVEIDVRLLYPKIANVDKWLTHYQTVVDKVRRIRNFKQIQGIVEEIDASKDSRYRASLALNLLVYIFPHTWRFSKAEVQQRFLKEYKTMEELKSAGPPMDLQLRYIQQCQQIVYADFCVCGFIYKCVDLLEALTYLFHYIMALDLRYPRMCTRIWQFIQLAIFNVQTDEVLLPQIECTINDLMLRENKN